MQAWFLRGIRHAKDLELGDTASYYLTAIGEADHLRLNPLWSPAYTVTLGLLHWVFNDAFDELLSVRIVAVIVIDLLLLTILRSVATAGIALGFTVAFAANPVFFDSIYSVHLFVVIFPLAALALSRRRDVAHYRIPIVIILLLGGLLARNEYLALAVLFALYALLVTCWGRMRKGGEPNVRASSPKWARRAIVVGVIILGGYLLLLPFRSTYTVPDFQASSSQKHTLNVCQVYAYYLTQAQDWQGSPWLDCQTVMRRDFGVAEPTLTEALRANPGAIVKFLRWNLKLLPSGIALGLTGHYSEGPNPDYVPQTTALYALPAAAAMVILALAGVAAVFATTRGRRFWRLRHAPDTIVLAGGVVALMGFIALTQRPRPSYLYILIAVILLFAAWFVTLMLRRWRAIRVGSPVVALVVIAICMALPQHFGSDYTNVFSGNGQPVLQQYRAATAAIARIGGKPDIVIRTPSADATLCSFYLPPIVNSCTAESAPALQVEARPPR